MDEKTFNKTRRSPFFAAGLRNGRNVVALGGGTGLPVVLRSLKNRLFAPSLQQISDCDRQRLTAIVTVTDDGGSSGRLRREFDILPPGDIRNCLAALSDDNVLSCDIFQYRFEKGDGLAGHTLGNLFLAALTDIKGDFTEAIRYFSRMMNVKGQILPLTSTKVTLVARFTDGNVIKGETSIVNHKGQIRHVFLIPPYSDPLPSAIDAIENADAIIIGPGSLYTSILPNLLVKDLVEAMKHSKAKKIYVCNHMTEPGETDGYTATDHIKAILDHTEYGLLEYVILNKKNGSSKTYKNYMEQGYCPVRYNLKEIRDMGLASIVADVVSEKEDKIRHDEDKLGRLLMEII